MKWNSNPVHLQFPITKISPPLVSAELMGHQNHQMFKSVTSQHVIVFLLQKYAWRLPGKQQDLNVLFTINGFHQENSFCLQSDENKYRKGYTVLLIQFSLADEWNGKCWPHQVTEKSFWQASAPLWQVIRCIRMVLHNVYPCKSLVSYYCWTQQKSACSVWATVSQSIIK